jgi:hypothetical protein
VSVEKSGDQLYGEDKAAMKREAAERYNEAKTDYVNQGLQNIATPIMSGTVDNEKGLLNARGEVVAKRRRSDANSTMPIMGPSGTFVDVPSGFPTAPSSPSSDCSPASDGGACGGSD